MLFIMWFVLFYWKKFENMEQLSQIPQFKFLAIFYNLKKKELKDTVVIL